MTEIVPTTAKAPRSMLIPLLNPLPLRLCLRSVLVHSTWRKTCNDELGSAPDLLHALPSVWSCPPSCSPLPRTAFHLDLALALHVLPPTNGTHILRSYSPSHSAAHVRAATLAILHHCEAYSLWRTKYSFQTREPPDIYTSSLNATRGLLSTLSPH